MLVVVLRTEITGIPAIFYRTSYDDDEEDDAEEDDDENNPRFHSLLKSVDYPTIKATSITSSSAYRLDEKTWRRARNAHGG
jgi:hypothetical protein